VFFIDFALSLKASDVADFQARCSAELAALDEVFTPGPSAGETSLEPAV
jgi:hypothetical protein